MPRKYILKSNFYKKYKIYNNSLKSSVEKMAAHSLHDNKKFSMFFNNFFHDFGILSLKRKYILAININQYSYILILIYFFIN